MTFYVRTMLSALSLSNGVSLFINHLGQFFDSELFAGKKNFSAKCRNFGSDKDQLMTVAPNILFLIKSLNVWNWE